jgi:hypothetical protein
LFNHLARGAAIAALLVASGASAAETLRMWKP